MKIVQWKKFDEILEILEARFLKFSLKSSEIAIEMV